MRALEEFVADYVSGRGPAKRVTDSISDAPYNRVIRFSFASGGSDVVIKFPKPGYLAAALAAEKIENEAAWVEFLKGHTSIPVPHVYSSGTESPLKLPYVFDGLGSERSPPQIPERRIFRRVTTNHLSADSFFLS